MRLNDLNVISYDMLTNHTSFLPFSTGPPLLLPKMTLYIYTRIDRYNIGQIIWSRGRPVEFLLDGRSLDSTGCLARILLKVNWNFASFLQMYNVLELPISWRNVIKRMEGYNFQNISAQ